MSLLSKFCPEMKPGAQVPCTIDAKQPGGYSVRIPGLPGWNACLLTTDDGHIIRLNLGTGPLLADLETDVELAVGTSIVALFVGVKSNRPLLIEPEVIEA